MKRILIVLFVVLSCIVLYSKSEDNLSTRIRQNYVDILMASDVKDKNAPYVKNLMNLPDEAEISDRCVIELYQRKPVDIDEVAHLLNTIQSDGTWPDINYQDKTRSGWKVKTHIERIFLLSRYKRLMSDKGNDKEADESLDAISKAIKWWVEHNPICPNWFHNEIGVPRTLGPALLLIWDDLSDELQRGVMEVVYKQHVRFGKTGQNKVWQAGNVLIKALLLNDDNLLKRAHDTIASEIKLGQKEGIQKDWSFHQHGAQQQFGNYGLAYLSSISFYDELFQHTSLEFTKEQRSILTSLLEKGYAWIHWNNRLDLNCFNRQYFRNVDSDKFQILQLSAQSLTGQNVPSPRGNKFFDCSDMTIQRTQNWMASIKMASNRVIGIEQLNGDNQKGYYAADGATFVYVDGEEYHNIFPLWDWRKIPGTTCYQSEKPVPGEKSGLDKRNHSDFVGGVSDGSLGVTAMELNRNSLHARKMWAFNEDLLLCLGSDIRTDSLPVATTIEQCYADGVWDICGSGRYYMNKKGYVTLGNTRAIAEVETRSGNWNEIMSMYKPKTVTGDIATLYIDHALTQNGTYAYVILPDMTRSEVKAFDSSQIKIYKNSKDLQLVQIKDVFYAVAYLDNTQFTQANGEEWKFSAAGIYLGKKDGDEWKVTYQDPTRTGKQGTFVCR